MHLFFLLFTFLFTQNGWAFKINLVDSSLDPAKKSSTTATILNDSDGMIAIEATARLRVYNEQGEENFDDIADDLMIIPSQMIIHPNDKQVLNIRWLGDKDIPKEQAYRLLIEYVSISDDELQGKKPAEQQAGITINYRIAKSFYVCPKNAKPSVTLQGASKINLNGEEKLRLSFNNVGEKHMIVSKMNIQFMTESGQNLNVALTEQDFNKINFLAQESRDVIINWPTVLQGTTITSAQILNFNE